jgi:cation diffusion facilitator family transporter
MNIEQQKVNVAIKSLYAALFITTIKIIAAYVSGSLAVLSEVFHSGIDIFVCVITIISVKYSSKPPDADHQYGHEKIENFSALIQVIILFATSAYIIYEAMNRLFFGKVVELNISIWIFIALIVSMIIDFTRSRALMKIARKTKSSALEADALHFSTDILSSSIVIIGLVLIKLGISDIADSIAALVVTSIIIYLGFRLGKKSIDSLMDRVPAGLTEKIKYETLLIEGVEGIKSQRIRATGPKTFIDMTIQISRLVPFAKAHDIMDFVERKIEELIPGADVIVHSEPVETEKETINDKIRMIVNRYNLKSHDIFSHRINNEIYTELHIEIDNTNDIIKAHSLVDEIERKIKEEIEIISNVKIHIDEPSEKIYDTIDITGRSYEIIERVNIILNKSKDVIESSEIKILNSNGKLRISMNCAFDTDKSFEEIHEIVTVLESKIFIELKKKHPNITNVMIHSEPKK